MKSNLLQILSLALALPSAIAAIGWICFQLYDQGILSKKWILIILIFVMADFVFLILYYFKKKKA
ncbi:MAG: hypothetical protein HQK50_16700 [Oligoflexia bacterium]|nr:hypothetical protein [Oligoflexia bacterium]MBF0367218.1 hypothetical protein [Oligoflexia bacterium]